MLNIIKKSSCAALLSIALPIVAYAGTAPIKMNNVVVTGSGMPVRTASGDCLYTSGTDPMGTKCDVQYSEQKNVLHKIDIVFFDFNKSDLKKEAIAKVHNVYTEMSKYHDVKITLVGHTDFVGSEKYNMNLSKKRADTVKKELSHLGVPAKEIKVEGKGYSELMVPTAKGVKEAKNRRVEMFYTLY